MSKVEGLENVKCPECDGEMVSRKGQFGVFWGCKSFPHCKGTRDNQGRSKQDREAERLDKRDELGSYGRDIGEKKHAENFTKVRFNK